jgi:hypothetical protein
MRDEPEPFDAVGGAVALRPFHLATFVVNDLATRL